VKYWEMDNENYRRFDAITYAHKVVAFSRAMKAVDPSIKIIMANYYCYHPAFAQMLEIAGPDIDMVVNRNGPIPQIQSDAVVLRDYNARHNRAITLCDTEHNAHDYDPIQTAVLHPDGVHPEFNNGDPSLNRDDKHSFWTYAMGTMSDYMDLQNLGGSFQFCCYYGTFNEWGLGLINCGLDRPNLSAPGAAIEFMQSQPIAWPLAVSGTNDPTVKYSAAWNIDKTVLTVQVLNYNAAAKHLSVDLSHLGVSFDPDITVDQLSAPGPRAVTQENLPSPIDRETKTVDVGSVPFEHVFPPYSASAIRVKLKLTK
jgi:alpha-N-arabinofuranosidase